MNELSDEIRNCFKEATKATEYLLEKLGKQKDLEKPPPHKWEHMDVFRNSNRCEMIYTACGGSPDRVFCVGQCTGHHNPKEWTDDAEFLFNLKEKL